ncbi:F-box protein At4g00893 [Eutrema salsugineum]|nr:F-box protein At4g00893 [Eutrema salsugineum]
MSLLVVKDNIKASTVCKAWYKSGASILMKDRHLWFMKYPISPGNIRPCELYDPSQKMTYLVKYPEVSGMTIYYSKDGWLLMHKDYPSDLFFFNPFTRQRISLPDCDYYIECAVFTCAPTSDRCLVFGLTNVDNNKKIVGVNTFRLGETRWETSLFMSPESFFAYYNKIIYSGDLFYCLGGLGSLAVFDPSNRTWNTPDLKYEGGSTTFTSSWFGTYLLEIKGDIFLLKCQDDKPRVFMLNRNINEGWTWKEKERFEEGLTIYGAFRATEYRSNLENDMNNKLLLSDSHHPLINTYFFDEGRYLPNKSSCFPTWNDNTIFQSIWIEPPKLSLDFI